MEIIQNTLKRKKIKILVIEDEGDISLVLNIILKGRQIDLEYVHTLSQAKIFLGNETPALIFLNNTLPDGPGLDFIKYLKKYYPVIKIVMITGYHLNAEREIAISYGADLFLEKPFTRNQIQHAVHDLLEIDLTVTA